MTFDRFFSMPNSHTFKMAPVKELIESRLFEGAVVVDPFARDSQYAGAFGNDFNPEFGQPSQRDAVEFCDWLVALRVQADVLLFDPPYSPRQISECYKVVGRKVGINETQNARLYKEVRDRLTQVIKEGGVALSFGWNSIGFGLKRGFEMEHVRLVTHGGAHNDTICTVEHKVTSQDGFWPATSSLGMWGGKE